MRLKRTACIAIVAATALVGAAACGGEDKGSDDGDSGSKPKGKVGIILPDTKTSDRWEKFDYPMLTNAFKQAGVTAVIQNAEGDKQKMATIADQMITGGVTILAVVNLDSESAAAIQAKAKTKGVKTIDYDRLTLGGSADYYVSFDGTEVGRVQGRGLQKCLGEKQSNIIYLNGAPSDNNATLFKNGAHEVLDPITNYKKLAEQAVPDWDNAKAATIFEQLRSKHAGKIDGVLAANDGLGNAAISVLKKNKEAGKVQVTGQDATVPGLQNVLEGTQCMTVYKPIKQVADALVKVAVALSKGEKAQTNATEKDPEGKRDVPSVLLKPVLIDKTNVKQVIDDGFVSKEEVCKGKYAAKCEAAGIS